jgi:hypothetical protein
MKIQIIELTNKLISIQSIQSDKKNLLKILFLIEVIHVTQALTRPHNMNKKSNR